LGVQQLPIRTLVVDDTAFMRRALVEILERDPDIEVVGVARHGKEALEAISRLEPDVVTLDIDMPVMDGLTAIKHIMVRCPRPVVVVSGLAEQGAVTLEALRLGAVDFFPKPSGTISPDIGARGQELSRVVKQAARISPRSIRRVRLRRHDSPHETWHHDQTPSGIVIIQAHKGASGNLIRLLANLRPGLPVGIIAIQDIASEVLASYSLELRALVPWSIVAGSAAAVIPGGCVLTTFASVSSLELQNGRLWMQPGALGGDVNLLMTQAAQFLGPHCLAIILGGPPDQVLVGLKSIREAGGAGLLFCSDTPYAQDTPCNDPRFLETLEAITSECELWQKIESFSRAVLLHGQGPEEQME